MMNVSKPLILAMSLALALAGACKGKRNQEPGPAVVAKVNGESISQSAYEAALGRSLGHVGKSVADAVKARVRSQVLDQLIEEALLRQKAVALGVAPNAAAIDKLVEGAAAQYGSPAQFAAYLERSGLTTASYRDMVAARATRDAVLGQLTKPVPPTDDELRQHYETYQATYVVPKAIKARQILIGAEGRSADEMSARAAEVRAKLTGKKGGAFAELAKTYSDDAATRDIGGDLGMITAGQMIPEVQTAAFAQAKGTISEPIASPFGLHLVEVLDIREPSQRSFDEAKDSIREALVAKRQAEAEQAALAALRHDAKVELVPQPAMTAAPSAAPAKK